MTHDYKRNGTTDLFAALNVATGEVLYDCRKRHTSNDVLAFFKFIDLHVPRDLEVHVVLDNLSAHMGPEVAEWLAHPKRARWHLHFTPTSSSWLNLVERLVQGAHRTAPAPGRLHQRAPLSSTPSRPGPSTGTTTPSPSSGTSRPRRSSPRCAEAGSTLHQIKSATPSLDRQRLDPARQRAAGP